MKLYTLISILVYASISFGNEECAIQELISIEHPLEFFPSVNATLWFWAPVGAIFKMQFNRQSENSSAVESTFGIEMEDTEWKTAVIDWPGILGQRGNLKIPDKIQWNKVNQPGEWISSDQHTHSWTLYTWKYRNLQIFSHEYMLWSNKDPKTLDLFGCHDFISNLFLALMNRTDTPPPATCPTITNISTTPCPSINCTTACKSSESSPLSLEENMSSGTPLDSTSSSTTLLSSPMPHPSMESGLLSESSSSASSAVESSMSVNDRNYLFPLPGKEKVQLDCIPEPPLLPSRYFLLEGLAGALLLCMVIIVALSISYHRMRVRIQDSEKC